MNPSWTNLSFTDFAGIIYVDYHVILYFICGQYLYRRTDRTVGCILVGILLLDIIVFCLFYGSVRNKSVITKLNLYE